MAGRFRPALTALIGIEAGKFFQVFIDWHLISSIGLNSIGS
jgi:hypothetical protein